MGLIRARARHHSQITRVLDKHIHPVHTFYDIMLQMTQYALNEKHRAMNMHE